MHSSEAPAGNAIRAAAYVRMSTEHQQYSTSNQMDAVREYAARRGMDIVKIYSDEGKSGLNIQGRDSLSTMISDVTGGLANFTCILVYDVSRWGRFQDADESAHYEYICRRVGIAVHYCAEQFENDGSLGSSIIKTMKRSMAGEYSRELSTKVFRGACRLIQLGFKQGGAAGYGMRRMLIDQSGEKKAVLKIGEQKSLQTDRVILVPGPEEEVMAVRAMYHAFVTEGKSETTIAQSLNDAGILTDFGRKWNRTTVREVLTNEKYIGNNVYHRTSFKLKQKHTRNPEELTNEELLERLRLLLRYHGKISGILINESEGIPSSAAYRSRFGSLMRAYTLVGYRPNIDFTFIEVNRRLRCFFPDIIQNTISKLIAIGARVAQTSDAGIFILNDEIRVSLVLCRHRTTQAGASRWEIRLDHGLCPDLTIAVRMDHTNENVKDYYLLPSLDMTWDHLKRRVNTDSLDGTPPERLHLAEANGIYLDTYRYDSLERFFELSHRLPVDACI
jgi:DNA invertase Pin-like site-specific DNA recombinase